jgi:proteasome lid subunit RPN8/RPN11
MEPFTIKENLLALILHASRTAYPLEFGALLRGKENQITEALLLPGTIQGKKHVLYQLNMLPIDSKVVGSVHSHPGPSNRPSQADLQFFKKTGRIHLIIKQPARSIEDVAAYDKNGGPLALIAQ